MDRPALSGRDDGPTYAGEVARISGPGERRPEQHGPAPVDGPAARQLQLERRTCGARLSKLRRGRRPAPAMKRCQGGSGRSSVVVSEPSKAPPVYLRRRLVRQYGRRKAMRIAFLSTVAVATLSLSVAALGQSPQSPPSGGGGGVERSQSGSGSGGASGSAGQSQGSQQRSGQSTTSTSSGQNQQGSQQRSGQSTSWWRPAAFGAEHHWWRPAALRSEHDRHEQRPEPAG